MFNTKLSELFGVPNRLPEEKLTQDHKDMVNGLQSFMKNYFLNY